MNHPASIHDKREQFSSFVSILSGEFGVNISFDKKNSDHNSIYLPEIEKLSPKHLDLLYALCLREVGFIAKSKRPINSFSKIKTHNQLFAAFTFEAARTELALIKSFLGAGEIFDNHWMKEAFDLEFSSIVFGFDPAQATKEQCLVFAFKLALLGNPKFGWQKIFHSENFAYAQKIMMMPELIQLSKTKIKNWNDSIDLSISFWDQVNQITGSTDKSDVIKKTKKAAILDSVAENLTQTIPDLIKNNTAVIEQKKSKIKEFNNTIEEILASNKDEIKNLQNQISALNKKSAPLNEIQSIFSKINQIKKEVNDAQEKLNKKLLRQENIENEIKQRAEKIQEKTTQQISYYNQKIQDIDQKLSNEIDSINSRKSEINEKIDTLENDKNQRIANEKTTSTVENKIKSLQEKLDQLNQKIDSKMSAADAKKNELLNKNSQLEQSAANANTPTPSSCKKMENTNRAISSCEDQINQKEERLATEDKNAQEAAKKVARENPEIANISSDDLMSLVNELSNKIDSAKSQLNNIKAPAVDLKNKIQKLKEEMKAEQKKANKIVDNEMQKIQSQLDAAGIDMQICEKMENIDGWDAANKLQADFDKKASSELDESVINGCGGGNGHRNLMEEITATLDGINEINPNEIFADVEKLSPLSGFSQSGAFADKNGGAANIDHKENSSLDSSLRHTVWTKIYDKIEPAQKRDIILLGKLKFEFRDVISKTKSLFKNRLKPTYKNKFIGGKEEGDIDARNIWKLAARQGEDFYEISRKNPEKKSSAIILVDLSGSCASWGTDATRNIQALTLTLSESLNGVNIEHEILGFCAPIEEKLLNQKIPDTFNRKSCRLKTIVAKGFNQKDLAGIASLEIGQYDNSDGESLKIAVDRLKKRNGKNKLIFMISDGKPFMQDSDSSILDADLRKSISYAQANKINLVSMGFGKTTHAVLGSEHITIDDLSKFPDLIAKKL